MKCALITWNEEENKHFSLELEFNCIEVGRVISQASKKHFGTSWLQALIKLKQPSIVHSSLNFYGHLFVNSYTHSQLLKTIFHICYSYFIYSQSSVQVWCLTLYTISLTIRMLFSILPLFCPCVSMDVLQISYNLKKEHTRTTIV